jgi:hypothetical protein
MDGSYLRLAWSRSHADCCSRILDLVESRCARSIDEARRDRIASMAVDERLALLKRLSDEGLTSYMALHGVDRRTAVERIKATRRLGRRPSSCG